LEAEKRTPGFLYCVLELPLLRNAQKPQLKRKKNQDPRELKKKREERDIFFGWAPVFFLISVVCFEDPLLRDAQNTIKPRKANTNQVADVNKVSE
jgi:hypothetical protein